MQYEDVLNKFLDAGVFPSKYSVQDILGFSVGTLRRKGFVISEIQRDYKYCTRERNYCRLCGCEIDKNKTFCSRSCASKFNSKNRDRKYCFNCGVELKGNDKYCSHSCRVDHKYKEYIEKWLSGEVVECNSKIVPTPIRKYLFIKYESKCARCGWGEINPVTGNSPLEVEHIDGDSTNNKPDNLTLLCPNCHSLTPTYKALNKGNGRHSRRIRYQEGKSY